MVFSTASDFDECSSSSSTDSYSYLFHDRENPNNSVCKEWESIERTLYGEEGDHIKSPALAKECRLWRDSFPHLRVKGTQVVPEDDRSSKDCQTDKCKERFVDMGKLREKRDQIKQDIANRVVQGLITKFKSQDTFMKALDESRCIGDPVWDQGESLTTQMGDLTEGAIDFPIQVPRDNDLAALATPKKTNSLIDTTSMLDGKFEAALRKGESYFERGKVDEPGGALKSILKQSKAVPAEFEKSAPLDASLKLSSKYEAMLATVLRNSGVSEEFGLTDGLRSTVRAGRSTGQSYKDKLASMRVSNNFDEFMKRHKRLPQINKFENNWMGRRGGDRNDMDRDKLLTEVEEHRRRGQERAGGGSSRKSSLPESTASTRQVPRPKAVPARPSKSCGDKSGACAVKPSPKGKPNTLPPLESGIICTELTAKSQPTVKKSFQVSSKMRK